MLRCFDKLSNHKAHQAQAQRPFQQVPAMILFKKRFKIISDGYLIPKLVVKNNQANEN